MFKKIWSFLISKKVLVTINLVLAIAGIFFNRMSQGFCNPSIWASVLIGVSLLFVILSPLSFLKSSNSIWVGFVAGISFSSFLYCVIFLAHINLYAFPLVILGIGIILLIPHFFAFQLILRFFFKTIHKRVKLYFVLGVFSCFLVFVYAGISYNIASTNIKKLDVSNYTEFEKDFMTEKILGMHFIYHTKICEYDGWRPPIHEPLLVLGMWWNSMEDPLGITLEDRLKLYRKTFPTNLVKFNCSCAVDGSDSYHKDKLWKL